MASSYLQERRKKIKTKELAHRQTRIEMDDSRKCKAKLGWQNLCISFVHCIYRFSAAGHMVGIFMFHLRISVPNSQPKSGFACAGKFSRDSARQPCSTCWSTSDFWRFFLNTLLFCTLLNVSPYMRIYSFTYHIHSYTYTYISHIITYNYYI